MWGPRPQLSGRVEGSPPRGSSLPGTWSGCSWPWGSAWPAARRLDAFPRPLLYVTRLTFLRSTHTLVPWCLVPSSLEGSLSRHAAPSDPAGPAVSLCTPVGLTWSLSRVPLSRPACCQSRTLRSPFILVCHLFRVDRLVPFVAPLGITRRARLRDTASTWGSPGDPAIPPLLPPADLLPHVSPAGGRHGPQPGGAASATPDVGPERLCLPRGHFELRVPTAVSGSALVSAGRVRWAWGLRTQAFPPLVLWRCHAPAETHGLSPTVLPPALRSRVRAAPGLRAGTSRIRGAGGQPRAGAGVTGGGGSTRTLVGMNGHRQVPCPGSRRGTPLRTVGLCALF